MKTKKPINFDSAAELVAACGMNCGICMAYLREKKKCPGCRGNDINKSVSCVNCRIKNCLELNKHNFTFCIECSMFPCERINHLDKRYRTKYHMSMIDNLNYIQKQGMQKFLECEHQRWRCLTCGNMVSCHNGICYHCHAEATKSMKKPLMVNR